jgi:hypothetical protein
VSEFVTYVAHVNVVGYSGAASVPVWGFSGTTAGAPVVWTISSPAHVSKWYSPSPHSIGVLILGSPVRSDVSMPVVIVSTLSAWICSISRVAAPVAAWRSRARPM